METEFELTITSAIEIQRMIAGFSRSDKEVLSRN